MPYFKTSEEWQRQSSLLLKARPSTTRITTKYHIPSPSNTSAPAPDSTADVTQTKAFLELKTYDPASGTCLKYKTDKAAEVGRLIATMGSLGRNMAALPEVQQDIAMPDAPASGAQTPLPETATEQKAPAPSAGKKKKKGKK